MMSFHKIPLYGGLLLLASTAWAGETVEPEVPQQTMLSSSIDKASDMLMYALSLVGVNYKYGGKSPDTGLDCSGFVSHVYKQAAGLILPHNARAISMFGQKIAISELQPGDLVFYNTLRHAYSHVGIYLGENKFIHASVTGRGVEVVNMNENYWVKRFNGARRVVTSRLPFAASNE
ncbi:C40 family peptidase [Sulfuricella sp.]|uniref:C40 family peptidase n=1 Tax=Sulfuricella sp. TaxID=2099377 RepID=UPI002CC5C711|nr:C40 family peptidase [Sulfuricella sp.]HUX63675.1 C40 family peptidase [Sulfuricella sp.]